MSHPVPPHDPASALALAAEALAVPFAQLFRATDRGLVAVATWDDGWDEPAPELAGLAATFDDAPERYDVSALAGPGAVATGCRLGDAGAFVVVEPGPEEQVPTPAVRLAAASLAAALAPQPSARRELLAEMAGAPGPFPDRLATALQRAATLFAVPAAALVRVDSGVWTPETVWDPGATGLFDGPRELAETVCRSTVQSDGPLGLHAAEHDAVGAYLGAPVCVGGAVFGTLCFASPEPRPAPFSEADRALTMALARWAGHALEGRLAAEALATRQALLGTLYASAPIGLATVELVEAEDAPADVRFLSTNHALADLLGTAPGSADGATAEALGVPLRMRRLWTGACRRAHAGSPARRFEFSPQDGLSCAATIARIGTSASPPRYVVVVEDVTSQRAAAESLREEQAGVATLLRHAPAFIATADLDGAVLSLRGRPASEGAATVFDLFPDSVPSAAALHRALGGEPSAWTAEVAGRTFHAHAIAQRDASGLRTGLTVVGLDVTSQTAAARAAADLDARSAAGAELRRALVVNLAHELRTPLAALLGYADLLGDGLDPADLADAVAETSAVAQRAGRRVLAAVDDLQELVLLGEERLPSAVAPAQVAGIVQAAVEASRADAHALGAELAVHADGAGGPLLIDSRLLSRAARQLVARALQGTDAARVAVRLTTGGEAVCLEAQHDGEAGAGDEAAAADDALDRLARAMGGAVTRDTVSGRHRVRVRLPRRPVRLVDLGSPDAASEPLPAPAAPDGAAPDAPRLADVLAGNAPEPSGELAESPAEEKDETVPAEATPTDAAPPSSPPSSGDGASVGRTLDLTSLLSADQIRERLGGR